MRFSIVTVVLGAVASASASLVARQSGLPSCAVSCTTSADLGSCQITDTKCLCTSPAFVSSTTTCIEKSCTNPDDLKNALAFSQGLCLTVGVTLSATLPGSATASGSSHSASGSSTPAATSGSASVSQSGSAAASSSTAKSGASSTGANSLFGLAAAGLVAFAL